MDFVPFVNIEEVAARVYFVYTGAGNREILEQCAT